MGVTWTGRMQSPCDDDSSTTRCHSSFAMSGNATLHLTVFRLFGNACNVWPGVSVVLTVLPLIEHDARPLRDAESDISHVPAH